LHALVETAVVDLGAPVREHPAGVFRVAARFGDVQVIYVDALDDLSLVERAGAGEPAVFVVGSAPLWPPLPTEIPRVALADLVLDAPHRLRELLTPMLGSAVAPPPQRCAPPPPPTAPRVAPKFLLPPWATWKNVTIYYVDGATLGITVPGSLAAQFTAVDLGMAKLTNRMGTKGFELLVHLCRMHGRTDLEKAANTDEENHPITFKTPKAFSMQVAALGEHLQRLFGLDDDPFPNFGNTKELVAAFEALPDRPGHVALGLDCRAEQSGHRASGG
jgi:hypothetical protein